LKKIAIIGAGLSGLVLANMLKHRADVKILEKSGGVGGRMATRKSSPYQFDHGAQFFVAKTDRFKAFLQPYLRSGGVAVWKASFVELKDKKILSQRLWTEDHPHYVGVPGMTGLGKQLAEELDIRLRTRVTKVEATPKGWKLVSGAGISCGTYDWVVCTAPAAQSAELMPGDFSHLDTIREIEMTGCFALLLGFSEPICLPWQAALVHHDDISWISVNSSKPCRHGECSLVIHASNAWSEAHMDDHADNVENHLMREASRVIERDLNVATYKDIHRWRYANAPRRNGPATYIDETNRLAVCGDWCIQGRVEAAFLSAMALAEGLESAL